MNESERIATIPITPELSDAIIAEAPAAPEDDFAAAAETAIAKVLRYLNAELYEIQVGSTALEVRWFSEHDAAACARSTVPLLEQGRVSEAAILMELLLSTDPDNATMLSNLGMVYSDGGYLERAIAVLRRALEINPNYDDGFVAIGVAYTRSDDLTNAQKSLEDAIELNPDNPWAYRNLGVVYLRREMPDEAVTVLTKATELSPEDVRAWFGLAEALELVGEISHADDAYQHVISINEYGDMAERARNARSKIAAGEFRGKSDLRMDAVMYLLSALKKFKDMDNDQLQAIGFEIAILGTNGINVNDPESSYAISTLPGEFSGLSLVCHQYAAFKRFAPHMDIGFDLSREYEAAVELFQKQRT